MKRKDRKGRVLLKGESVRKDGRYVYRWKDYNGKEKAVYSTDLNELREKEAEINKKIMIGISNETKTLNDLILSWLVLKQNISMSSRQLYETLFSSAISSSKLGKMQISQINTSDVMMFISYLQNDKHLKQTTISTIYTIINQSLQLAYNDGLILKNPAASIKISKKTTNIKDALTDEQSAELLRRIKNDKNIAMYYPLVGILLITGLRISEAAGLTWEDIDTDNGIIRINKQLILLKHDNDNKKRLTVSQPKTTSGNRKLYMTDFVREMFIMQRESQECKSSPCIDGYTDFVFLTSRGTNLSARSIQQILKRVSEDNDNCRVKLPHISPHTLRHTACTNMIKSGMNVKAVQSVMGHSSAEITLDIYTHLSQEQLMKETQKFNDFNAQKSGISVDTI